MKLIKKCIRRCKLHECVCVGGFLHVVINDGVSETEVRGYHWDSAVGNIS